MKPVPQLILSMMAMLAAGAVWAEPWDFSSGPPANLPALSRYEAPVFPARLRPTTVTSGYATVVFTVKADGRVEDAVGLEASDPAFVESTLDALMNWRLAAAPSTTVPRREIVQFDYRRSGTVASLSHGDAIKSVFAATGDSTPAVRTLEWERMDRTPRRIAGSMPAYPETLRSRPVRGHAMIDFIIDATGRVRVPTIADSSAAEFGEAALAAVRAWRFEPPQEDGVAVNVRAIRSFSFGGGVARQGEARAPADSERIAQNP